MKTILVPIDFSQNSRQALDFALEYNELIKGELLLVHVVDLPIAKHGYIGLATQANMEVFYGKDAIDRHQKLLEGWVTEVRDKGHFVKGVLKFGNPYQNLSQIVVEEKADWIIMGSKGASGLKEVFVGSNAERMIRYAKCPVITVKGEAHVEEIRSIVFATDATREQDSIAQKLKDVQQLMDLKIHLVIVRTFDFQTEQDGIRKLQDFAMRNKLTDYTTNSYQAAFPDQGIVEFAEQIKSGLIVLGTHGHTGLVHLFGGSWAEDVVNESTIPVMTFRLK
jgi:nucleotide-binding universal stress UspA family protein